MKDYFDNEYEYDWDDQYYGTGNTEPPKQRHGAMALMLILIIFLFGIITVLGVLNIRLFQELKLKKKEAELSISFVTEATVAQEETIELHQPQEASLDEEEIVRSSMQLEQSPQSQENIPMEGGLSLQEIYLKNIGSVVSISCTGYGSSSTGTGVVLSEDGYIVTNAHVVDGAGSVDVLLTDDRVFTASIIGSDEISDLAVLRVEATDLIPARFGDSTQLRIGDTVAAMAARFDSDVLPFKPKILVIMGGVNDFRSGGRAEEIIPYLRQIGDKCRAHGIIPVYATATPINPHFIANWHYITAPAADWKNEQVKLNQWIMQQQYAVDVASGMTDCYGLLMDEATTDGLHPDVLGKKMIGEAISNYLLKTFPGKNLLAK